MIEVTFVNNKLKIQENNEEIKYTNTEIEGEVGKFILFFENNIKDLFLYEEVELYHFARGTIIESLKNILNYTNIYISILEKLKEEKEIRVTTDDRVFCEIGSSIFNIQCNLLEVRIGKREKTKPIKFIYSLIKGFSNYLSFNDVKDKANILLITNEAGISNISISKEEVKYDSYYGKVYEGLQDIFNVLEIRFDKTNKNITKSIGKGYIPYNFIILYKRILSKKYLDENVILNNLNLIREKEMFYRGYNLNKIIRKFILNNLENQYKSYIIEMITAKRIIKKKKIEKVIVIDEADRFRCYIMAGNMAVIPTFAIQHGIINNASSSYLIPTNDPVYIPEKTFLWGEAFKRNLLKYTSIYKNENTVVVGQPRTDIFVDIMKEQINYRDDNNKRRILYATQYIKDLTEDATIMLCESLKGKEDYELLIKLHPADKFNDFYEECIKKYQLKNVNIIKNKDIYECLLWCDVILSVHSTVVLEGAILDKPSICILLPKYHDEGEFVKNGISIGVSNPEELGEVLFEDINKLKINKSNDYIKEYFYKVDGLVYNRILGEIENGKIR